MRRSLLTLFAVFNMLLLTAQQSLGIEPAVVKKQIIADLSDYNYEEIVKVIITNTNDERVRLRWDKEIIYQPLVWESQICDKEASYPPEATTNYDPLRGVNAPVDLAPRESFDLYLNIIPYRESGQCKIEIPFRSLDNPSKIIETLTFQINILDESTLAEQQKATRATIYPNPVDDYFAISGVPFLGRVEIFNTLGRKVKVFDDPQFGENFEVTDLPQGVYLVSLIDQQGKVVRTLRMLRRNFRP